jgi:hypothetical protein
LQVGVVKYAAYRGYEATRIETSDAMMALLAGAQLASHLLQLTRGSQHLLPEVYPNVPHIGRFNLTSDRAADLLNSADVHLGAMGVPYALSVHEDYLRSCLELLSRDGRCSASVVGYNLALQHGAIERATGQKFSADSLTQLTTLRKMRNCTIHEGGRADSSLVSHITRWKPSVTTAWLLLAKRSPQHLRVGDRVTFGHGELILSLAVTKSLAREANEQLQPTLSRTLWADLVIEELLADSPSAKRAPDGFRKTLGVARYYYSPLGLTEDELRAALDRA